MSVARSGLAGWLAAAAGATLLIAALFGWTVPRAVAQAVPGPTLGTFDYYNYFLPRFELGTEELLAGRLPAWNRFEYGGIPLLATAQPAALYPPKILAFAGLDAAAAMRAFLLFHYALLAGGFLLFARRLGVGPLGAFTGALYWTFNTTVLISNYHPNRIACLAWLPLLFLLADRVGRGGGRGPVALLAGVVAALLLAGYPAFALGAALLLAVHAVAARAAGDWTRPPQRSLPLLAAGFALGAGIAALQLLPLVELAGFVDRAELAGRSPARPLANAARFFVNQRGQSVPLFVAMAFPGLAALWLPGLLRRRGAVPAAGLAACGVMGLWGWGLLRAVPGFEWMRHNLLWLFLMQIYLAWLAALGADALARTRPRPGAAERTLAAAGAALWSAACLAHLAGTADFLYGGPGAHGLGLAGGILVAAAALAPARRGLLLAAAVGAVALGQLAAYPFGHPVGPLGYPPTRLRARVQLDRTGAELHGRVVSEEDVSHGYALAERVPVLFGSELSFPSPQIRVLERRLLALPSRRVRWRDLVRAAGFLDAMNVEYLLAPERVVGLLRAAGMQPVGVRQPRVRLFRNPDRLGDAWVVYGAREVASAEAGIDRVLAPNFDPRLQAVVEGRLASRYRTRAAHPPVPARLRRRSPLHLEVSVETPRRGILVVSEGFAPGWRARVDGEPARLLRADHLLCAVELPPGAHRVELRYRPVSLRAGLAASGAAILLAGGLLVPGADAPARRGIADRRGLMAVASAAPPPTLVIVPAYNEAASVGRVAHEVRACGEPARILVVDDGSSDVTAAAAREAGARVLRLPFNCGIGAAVRAGLHVGLAGGFDHVARIDGDGQHDPAVLPELLAALRAGKADFVIGSRFGSGEGFQSTSARRLGIRWFAFLLQAVCGVRVSDPTSGCWAANRRAARLLAAESSSDWPEVDSLVRLARHHCTVLEVPTRMRERRAGRSSIGGLDSLYYLVKVTLALLIGRIRPRPESGG